MTHPTKLPRGRHGLSRADVAGQQRIRILTALAEVLAERGYVSTPVAAIIERAGVSRETFYEQFASKADCFIAALEETVGDLAVILRDVTSAPGSPIERYDRMLQVYLDALIARPDTARLFLIETYAAGEDAMRRRLELQQQFVDGLVRIFGRRSARDRAACEALVGATVALVTARFVAGDIAGVRTVRKPLVDLAAARFGSGLSS
jgi:TetR/AcrR family transcriptional regulator